MSRLHGSIKLGTTVTIIFLAFIGEPVPVNSVKHRIVFGPTKMFTQCKNSDLPPFQKYFDFSHLKFEVVSDNSLQIKGYVTLRIDPPDTPLSAHTTIKQKVRGRWMNVPYVHHVKDFCAIYFKEGTYFNDNVSKYFAGDQRKCPPVKDLPLPVNITVSLELDLPTPIPAGEYMSQTVLKTGKLDGCYEMDVDMAQL